jgi:adhesin transport system outer membrane protein
MKMLPVPIGFSAVLSLSGLAAWLPVSSMAYGLNDAIQSAITHNPEVLAKLHQFRASAEDSRIAKADYLPVIDLNYEANRQNFQYPAGPGYPFSGNYTTKGWTLNLTQNLFRGLQTYHQVKEQDNAQQASYFDLLAESENMALQTFQAYADVLRYRQQAVLAQDNYAIHKGILGQLGQKEHAGVGNKVDMEQASGRLALAETNLITENSNLYDVSSRYRRLTGLPPPAQMDALPGLSLSQANGADLIKQAVEHSPDYLSALASVRSARDEVRVKRGAFAPTLDLQASKAPHTENYNGYLGTTRQSSVALIFNLNLFRGGADRARLSAASQKLNLTLDQRDRVCADMRQTLSIANNNVVKLQEQMQSLLQHQLSTEKARNAYRQQFNIGKRTLLDVLDSENELFDAQRAYVNASADQNIARATVLSHSGRLLETLQLKAVDNFQTPTPPSEEDRLACNSDYQLPAPLQIQTIPARSFGEVESSERMGAYRLDAPGAAMRDS